MPDTMRGVYTNLTDIRRSVFREVAKICYSMDPASGKTDDDLDREFDELPFKILPGDVATYRESVFLERAIIGERIRLAMGLPLSSMDKPSRVSEGFSEAENRLVMVYAEMRMTRLADAGRMALSNMAPA